MNHATFDDGAFGNAAGTPVPFIENDQVLADLNGHFDENYLGEETLLAAARSHGYQTAAIGKVGPAAIQDVTTIAPVGGKMPAVPAGIIVDDLTGAASGVPLPPALRLELEKAHLPVEAPTRNNGYGPTSPTTTAIAATGAPGTHMPNVVQQHWFIDVATRAILPWFARDGRPSRSCSGRAIRMARNTTRRQPRQIVAGHQRHVARSREKCRRQPSADPGLARSKPEDQTGRCSWRRITGSQPSAGARSTARSRHRQPVSDPRHLDAQGRVETARGTLPNGFLAIDLARDLQPVCPIPIGALRLARHALHADAGRSRCAEHPANGNGLLERTRRQDGWTAGSSANGGSV